MPGIGVAIKAIVILALLATLGGLGAAAVRKHDRGVVASVQVAITKADLEQERADHVRTVSALEAAASASRARADALSSMREAVAHAAPSKACVGSPVGAVIDGLRGIGAGGKVGAAATRP